MEYYGKSLAHESSPNSAALGLFEKIWLGILTCCVDETNQGTDLPLPGPVSTNANTPSFNTLATRR